MASDMNDFTGSQDDHDEVRINGALVDPDSLAVDRDATGSPASITIDLQRWAVLHDLEEYSGFTSSNGSSICDFLRPGFQDGNKEAMEWLLRLARICIRPPRQTSFGLKRDVPKGVHPMHYLKEITDVREIGAVVRFTGRGVSKAST